MIVGGPWVVLQGITARVAERHYCRIINCRQFESIVFYLAIVLLTVQPAIMLMTHAAAKARIESKRMSRPARKSSAKQKTADVAVAASRDFRHGCARLLTLPEQIAERLAESIVNQSLAPGERLKEMELAAWFDSSRAPIREALRLLELRGLVQIRARRGVSVTQLSATEVDDLYEIRASLLGLAARRVAHNRGEDFLRRAKDLLGSLKTAVNESSGSRYFDATYALSNLIAEAADNPRLSELISSFSQQVARYTRMSLQTPTRRKASLRNWQRLLAAIETGDGDAAESVQKKLVFDSRDKIRTILETT